MARKKRLPGRNRLGRFQKKGAKKRRSVSRAIIVVRRKTRRAAKRRAKPRHVVRGHHRKVPGRARKVLVRRHLSREETPMKRRRARRSRARETVAAAERPRRRRRRSRARESAMVIYRGRATRARTVTITKPRKRRRARKSTALVRRTRAAARRSPRRYGRRVSVSRKVGPRGRRRSVTVRVAGRKKGRYGQKVRIKRRVNGRTRTRTVYVSERKRRRSPRRRASRRYAMAMYENPVGFGGYAMENPLSGKEMVLALATGVLGYTTAEIVDRLIATTNVGQDAPSQAQEALANAGLVQGAPNLMRGAAQAAVAGVPFLAAYWVRNPMGRAALQGFGLGAAVRLLGQLVRTMLIGRVLKDNPTAQRLYGDTIAADASQTTFQDIQDNMVPVPAGVSGPPRLGVGAPNTIAYLPYHGIANNDRSGYGNGGGLVSVSIPGGSASGGVNSGSGSASGGGGAGGGAGGANSGSGSASGGGGQGGSYSGSGSASGGPGGGYYGSGSAAGGPGGGVYYGDGSAIPGSVPYGTPYGIPAGNGCAPCGAQTLEGARQDAANTAGLGNVPYNPYKLMSED